MVNHTPTVVMLYSPCDGTANADILIPFLKQRNLTVLTISPEVGIKDPIFVNNDQIAGIILPGGPDIPLNDDPRKTFEIQLLEFAIKYKIPTLGICRGHQLIGHYFGAEIRTLHEHKGHEVFVFDPDSQIHQRLEKKYQKYECLKLQDKTTPTTFEKLEDNVFSYQTLCAHDQAIFFKPKAVNKQIIKITGVASDGTIEAMEINQHILTYQHHHEGFLHMMQSFEPYEGKIAKAALKQFVKLVKAYDEAHHNKPLPPFQR